jgi:hypothetical protein
MDTSNKKIVRELEKRAKHLERVRHEVINGIMSVANGREWMFDVLSRCHVFASSFTRDSLTTAFVEGERNVGLQIFNDIMQICPEQFIQMMREANGREYTDSVRRSDPSPRRDNSGSVAVDYEPDFAGEGTDGTSEG